MPRPPGIPEPLIARLALDTRFASQATLRRAIERAESLAADLDPGADYPEDFLAFRLLSYRPESTTTDVASGRSILASLPGLVGRWCGLCRLTADELDEQGGIEAGELADRWRVSRKTLTRWASLGLIPRRARDSRGTMRAIYMPDVVARFRTAHAAELARAAAFSRMPADEADRITRRAAAYQRKLGWPPTKAAKRLAERFGRSPEAIRQLLTQAEPAKNANESIRREMFDAYRNGADPSMLTKKFGCTRAAAQRNVNLIRHRQLKAAVSGFNTDADVGSWAKHPALAHALVCRELGRPGVTDLAAFFASARERVATSPRDERQLIEGLAALRAAAASLTGSINPLNPAAEPLDAAETVLRWASRLKTELMRRQLTLLVETADTAFGVPIETLPASRANEARVQLLTALAAAVDRADPATTGRIAAAAGLAMATAAARLARTNEASKPARAVSRIPPGIDIPDWTLAVDPWQAWLEPDARVRPALGKISAQHAEFLSLRYGLRGERPLTLTEIAKRLCLPRIGLPKLERRSIKAALDA